MMNGGRGPCDFDMDLPEFKMNLNQIGFDPIFD